MLSSRSSANKISGSGKLGSMFELMMCSVLVLCALLQNTYSMVPYSAHGRNKNIVGNLCKTTT